MGWIAEAIRPIGLFMPHTLAEFSALAAKSLASIRLLARPPSRLSNARSSHSARASQLALRPLGYA